MKTYNWTAKPFLLLSLLASFTILAATLSDYITYSDSFMELQDFKLVKRLDDSTSREVASNNNQPIQRPKVLFLPVNQSNRELINQNWLIYNYIDAEDQYHSTNEPTSLHLVGTSLVQVGSNLSEIYYVSFMSEAKNRIALFRAVENGYEILEAKLIHNQDIDQLPIEDDLSNNDLNNEESENKQALGINFVKTEGEFLLEHVIYTTKSGKVIKDVNVDGVIAISNGQIENLSVLASNELKELELEILVANINDGGQFMAEVASSDTPISGIISNAGKSWIIRMSTGEMAGFTLKFSREENIIERSEHLAPEDSPSVDNDELEPESGEEMIALAEELLEEAAADEDEALRNKALRLLRDGEKQLQQEEDEEAEKEEAADVQADAIFERAGFSFSNNGNR
jgi:hypothetical protein